MSAYHTNAASGWLNRSEPQDWTKRLADSIRTAFEAIETGRTASHDYRKLAVRGIPPQQATATVFGKHFRKR